MWSGGDPVLTSDKAICMTGVASGLGMSVATQAAEYSKEYQAAGYSKEFLREFVAAGGRGVPFSLYSSPTHPEIDDSLKNRFAMSRSGGSRWSFVASQPPQFASTVT